MKRKGILIAILLIAFVSCKGVKNKNTKDNSADTHTTASETSPNKPASNDNARKTGNVLAANRGTTGADSDLTDPTSSETTDQNVNETIEGTSTTSGNILNQNSGSTGAASNVMITASGSANDGNVDFEKMYTDLKMTDDQIQQFQAAMKSYKPSEGNDIEKEQNKKLKSILSEDQYEEFIDWRKRNH